MKESGITSEYSIQEVSLKLGIPIQKLRRWDDNGILAANRTLGGHRRYSREIIDRLAAASALNGIQDKESLELTTIKKSLDEKRRIIQLLLESEKRYRDLIETSHDLVWSTDAVGRFTYLNNASQEIFGLSPNELIGRCFFNFEVGSARISNRRFLATLRRDGEVKNYITHLTTVSGQDRWIGINARIVHDDNGIMVGIRGTTRDITDQHLATLRAQHLAMHDSLTDLPNRVSLQHTIEAAIQAGNIGAILFLDIDHFKYINDNFGHRAGDQLIIGLGAILRDCLRDRNAQLYRLGGDEFAIHLPECLRKDSMIVAEELLDAVRHYKYYPGEKRRITNLTASIGIALYPFHGSDLVGLLANVDIAMYQAKDHGRNRFVLFDQHSSSLRSTHNRIHWAKKLRDALEEDRLVLYSQPVVRLTDQQAMHHEVLVRLRDEEGRLILPCHFIEFAESLGLIREIDLRVVRKILNHLKHNNVAGQNAQYFINLSRVSISDQDWVRRFHDLLEESQVDPSSLVFEITETAAMSEIDVTLSFISKMKDMGCRFAFDDFGAGFSSFYYLKRFDVDYLKIDGSFIRDLTSDEGNRIFVKALNDVARGLNKQVIAEWVENQEVLNMLIEMGAQYGQGYLFKHPVPLISNVPVDDGFESSAV